MVKKGKFYVPIYDCDVKIIISNDVKKSVNTYVRLYGDKDEEKITDCISAYFFHPDTEDRTYYVFFSFDGLDIESVNHEKSHLIDYILSDRGIKPIHDTRAYLEGFISKKFHIFFTKNKLKIK